MRNAKLLQKQKNQLNNSTRLDKNKNKVIFKRKYLQLQEYILSKRKLC